MLLRHQERCLPCSLFSNGININKAVNLLYCMNQFWPAQSPGSRTSFVMANLAPCCGSVVPRASCEQQSQAGGGCHCFSPGEHISASQCLLVRNQGLSSMVVKFLKVLLYMHNSNFDPFILFHVEQTSLRDDCMWRILESKKCIEHASGRTDFNEDKCVLSPTGDTVGSLKRPSINLICLIRH